MCGKTIDAARPGLAPVSPRDRSRVATSAAEEPHCRAGPLPPRDFSLWSRPPHPPGSRRGFSVEPGCTQPLSRRSDSSGGWAGGGPARAGTGEEGCAQRGRGTMYGGARGRRLPGRRDSCRGGRDSADPCLKCAPQDLLVSPAGEGTLAADTSPLLPGARGHWYLGQPRGGRGRTAPPHPGLVGGVTSWSSRKAISIIVITLLSPDRCSVFRRTEEAPGKGRGSPPQCNAETHWQGLPGSCSPPHASPAEGPLSRRGGAAPARAGCLSRCSKYRAGGGGRTIRAPGGARGVKTLHMGGRTLLSARAAVGQGEQRVGRAAVQRLDTESPSSAGVSERLSCPPQLSGHLPRLAAPAGTAGACPRSSGNAQALSEHRQPPAAGAGTAA